MGQATPNVPWLCSSELLHKILGAIDLKVLEVLEIGAYTGRNSNNLGGADRTYMGMIHSFMQNCFRTTPNLRELHVVDVFPMAAIAYDSSFPTTLTRLNIGKCLDSTFLAICGPRRASGAMSPTPRLRHIAVELAEESYCCSRILVQLLRWNYHPLESLKLTGPQHSTVHRPEDEWFFSIPAGNIKLCVLPFLTSLELRGAWFTPDRTCRLLPFAYLYRNANSLPCAQFSPRLSTLMCSPP